MLGERLASMLDYNLSQLCGPKCTELKVRDAIHRFTWDPRFLLQQIVHVYLNLSSDKFAQYIASDEVSRMVPVTYSVRFLTEKLRTSVLC